MAGGSAAGGFFLYAGIALAAVGGWLVYQGGTAGTAGSTLLLMGLIWAAVAVFVRGFYGKMRRTAEEERALFANGTRATGIIEQVETTGTVLNDVNFQIRLVVRVMPSEGEAFLHERKMYVPIHGMPRPGDQIDVAFDPRDRSKVALAADDRIDTRGGRMLVLRRAEPVVENGAADAGDDIIEQLERLDQLRRNGVLTQAEFDEQKRRVLEE